MTAVAPRTVRVADIKPVTSAELRYKHWPTSKGELLALQRGTVWIRKVGDWTSKGSTVVIICPGGTGCAMFYKEWAEKLAEEYHGPVLLFDRYNMGLSDRLSTDKHPNALPLYTEQLSQMMERLEIPKVHFASFSFGSVVAAHFAAEYPNKVDRIAMCAPVIGGMGGTSPLSGQKLLAPMVRLLCPCLCVQTAFFSKFMISKLESRSEGQVEEGGDPDGLPIAIDMYRIRDSAQASTARGLTQGFLHSFWSQQTKGVMDLCTKLKENRIPVFIRKYLADPDLNFERLQTAIDIIEQGHPDSYSDFREGKHHQFYADDTVSVVATFLTKASTKNTVQLSNLSSNVYDKQHPSPSSVVRQPLKVGSPTDAQRRALPPVQKKTRTVLLPNAVDRGSMRY